MSGVMAYMIANLVWMTIVATWGIYMAIKTHRRERQFNDKIMQTIRVIAEAQKTVCKKLEEDCEEAER